MSALTLSQVPLGVPSQAPLLWSPSVIALLPEQYPVVTPTISNHMFPQQFPLLTPQQSASSTAGVAPRL